MPLDQIVKKKNLYKYVIKQLYDDGFTNLSSHMSNDLSIALDNDIRPNFLADIVSGDINTIKDGSCKNFVNYSTKFIATHKDECRVGVFSRDGTLAATGSADMSIKLLDVSKMHYHNQAKSAAIVGEYGEDFLSLKPVLRTFYDHIAPINDLDFHPNATLLASCSEDCSIKFFDHEKLLVKRSYQHIVEPLCIRSIQFHPTGDYLISGGDNPYIRIFNTTTFQAYISKDISNQHSLPINQVRYNADGHMYASCSKDGSIKYQDGVSNSCFRTVNNAHGGEQISSLEFSQDGKSLLSQGCDSSAKIQDVSSGREVVDFSIFKHHSEMGMQAAFTYDQSYVLTCDDRNFTIVAQDMKTGDKIREFEGHNKIINQLTVSPSEHSFISCSCDFRARFWAEDL